LLWGKAKTESGKTKKRVKKTEKSPPSLQNQRSELPKRKGHKEDGNTKEIGSRRCRRRQEQVKEQKERQHRLKRVKEKRTRRSKQSKSSIKTASRSMECSSGSRYHPQKSKGFGRHKSGGATYSPTNQKGDQRQQGNKQSQWNPFRPERWNLKYGKKGKVLEEKWGKKKKEGDSEEKKSRTREAKQRRSNKDRGSYGFVKKGHDSTKWTTRERKTEQLQTKRRTEDTIMCNAEKKT